MDIELNNYLPGLTIMDETNRRLRQARENAGFKSARAAALRHGWKPSVYASHENGQTSLKRLPEAAELYAAAFDVDPAYLLGHQTSPKLTPLLRPDGERVESDQLEPDQAKVLLAAIGDRKAEVWRITSDMMVGANFLPGDFVIVDLTAKPKPRDFVLAESSKIPIFRQYVPTNLWSFNMNGQNPPIPLDNLQTKIKGVILSKHSL